MASRSKIKLLIFTPTLQCGGSEKFVSTLCNNINTEIFSVCLVVLNNAAPFYEIKNKAIEVIDLEERKVRFSLFKIKSTFKKYQPDIIFTTANHLNLYFAIFRSWFPKNIKMLARESSIVSINSRRAKFPTFYNWLIKKFYNRFNFIICQSAYMQHDLVSYYNIPINKTAVIHNPTEDLLNNKTALPGNSEAGKTFKFITVTRLSEEKGVERLIHAVGLLSLPFQFYIIGEGDKKAYLQNLVHELQLEQKVFFKGQRTDPFSGMEDADLFLMGSYYEGFPNVLLEAGALGIPVIAFNAPGGISEIITAENGILADDNDLIGFAAAVKEGSSFNPMAIGFNRNKIMEITQNRFSVNVILPKIEELFIKLLPGSI